MSTIGADIVERADRKTPRENDVIGHKQRYYIKPNSVKFMIFDNQLAYCKLVS